MMIRWCALRAQDFFHQHIQPSFLPHLPPDTIFRVLTVLKTTPGQTPWMKFTIGMFAEQDMSLAIKDNRSDRNTKPRPDKPCNEYLKPERKLSPDIKQIPHKYWPVLSLGFKVTEFDL